MNFVDRTEAISDACGCNDWTLRVHCGDLRTHGASSYGCEACAPMLVKAMRDEYPDLKVDVSPLRRSA